MGQTSIITPSCSWDFLLTSPTGQGPLEARGMEVSTQCAQLNFHKDGQILVTNSLKFWF